MNKIIFIRKLEKYIITEKQEIFFLKMSLEWNNWFSTKYLAPITIILGLVGNLLGLIVILKKKLNKMGPQKIFICMFIYDLIYFPMIFHPYLAYGFGINITTMSSIACKLYWYARYSIAFVSPMMNAYISADRFISVAFPTKKFFLQKSNIQFIYISIIVSLNPLIAVIIPMYFDLKDLIVESSVGLNQTESVSVVCDFVNLFWQYVSGQVDLISRVIIPSFLMITFSVLIIASIFKSRNRIARNFSLSENETFRKDVRFSIVCVSLNIFYILFSLPISIVVLLPDYPTNEFYVMFSFLFFGAYCANFYLMFFFNKLFRKVFWETFCCFTGKC